MAASTRRRYAGAAPPQDPITEVARGLVTGYSSVRKFGHNDDVESSAFEDIWDGGGTYAGHLIAADEVRIKVGGNAADTANGDNARSVTIEGLDENWAVASETVATAGASASASTTTKFIRVFRAFVATVGAYGNTNLAAITIETDAGAIVAIISAAKGQTQMGLYTVPASKEAYIRNIQVTVNAVRTVDFRMFKREDADTIAAPFGPLRLISEFDGIGEAGMTRRYSCPPEALPAMTDIITRAKSDSSTAGVSVEFDAILIDV